MEAAMSLMTWEELDAEYRGMYERMETNDEGDITMRTVVEHIKAGCWITATCIVKW